MANKAQHIIAVLEPLAQQRNLDLVSVEIAGTTKNPILRVYLDTIEGGITLDQLTDAHRWVDAAIEQLDPFINSYVLEVSSPGIDRPLRKCADFERFAGEDVCIYLKKGYSPASYKGVLKGLFETNVIVCSQDDESEQVIAFDSIKKAHIVGKIDFNKSLSSDENQRKDK